MDYHKVMCKDFQAFYVPGLCGFSESGAAQTLTRIRETVFGLEYDENCLTFFPNYTTEKQWLKGYVDKKLLKKIEYHAKLHSKSDCGKISFIIFGHSHGGEMVVRAFESMKEEMSAADFKKIRDRSAVITMGSPKYINSNQAKITLNVLLENDKIATSAAISLEQNGADKSNNFLIVGPVKKHVCQCCTKRTKPTEGSLKPEDSLQQTVAISTAISNLLSCRGDSSSLETSSNVSKEAAASLSSKTSSVSTASTSTMPTASTALPWIGHYSTEYIACRNLRSHIKKKLGFTDDPIVCGCSN